MQGKFEIDGVTWAVALPDVVAFEPGTMGDVNAKAVATATAERGGKVLARIEVEYDRTVYLECNVSHSELSGWERVEYDVQRKLTVMVYEAWLAFFREHGVRFVKQDTHPLARITAVLAVGGDVDPERAADLATGGTIVLDGAGL